MKEYIYTIFLGEREEAGYISGDNTAGAALKAARLVGLKDPMLGADGAFPGGANALGERRGNKVVWLGAIFVREVK